MISSRLIKILSLLLVFWSCNKEDKDVFTSSVDTTDTVWVDNSPTSTKTDFQHLLDTLSTPAEIRQISDIKSKQSISFADDVVVDIPASSFKDESGRQAEGPAIVAFWLLNNRGEMIRNHFSNISNDEALKTAFAFKLSIIQNGKELVLSGNKETEIFLGDDNAESGFKLYKEVPASNRTNWTQTSDGRISVDRHNSKKGYSIELEQLGWLLAGQEFKSDKSTSITASLPKIFTNANTKLYVLLNDRKGMLEMGQDKNQKSFFANNIPTNSTGVVVSISSINNNYYLGTQEIELKHKLHIKINPSIISLAELNAFMDNLQ